MSRILEFYHRSVFVQLKDELSSKGYEIISISNYLIKSDAIEIDYTSQVVDMSSVANSFEDSSHLQMQLILEQVLPSIDQEVKFICDLKYIEEYKYNLRFCFDSFEEIQISQTNKLIETEKTIIEIKNNVILLNNQEFNDFASTFNDGLYGHDLFKSTFRELLESFRVFNHLGEHKVLSLFLMGESGVGKTEVGRQIHKSLKGNSKIAKINFGNYSSKDALNSLIGSPRGYIGSDGGELFDRVQKSDVGLILIDEFEKSNTAVFNYFLDVLENGKLTNSLGEEINVNGYIIIFTSNISTKDFKDKISPELRSRFDYIGEFKLLKNSDKQKFVEFRFRSIVRKYNLKVSNILRETDLELLCKEIDVALFKNMRDLNKKVKDIFVKYIGTISHETT